MKESVIAQAVTKGIYPDRQMKESDIYWIDSMPSEWQKSRLGYECKEMIVPMRDKPEFIDSDTGIPWCRIEDLEGKYLNGTKSGRYLSQETIKNMNLKVFPVNTILSACSAASVGAVAITTVPCCTNQTFIGLVAGKRLKHEFLYYYLFSIKSVLKSIGMGATIVYLSQDTYKKLPIPMPPYHEQVEIVHFLNEKTDYIDSIIKSKEAFLSELEKLKRTTIFEYCTGKKEVQDADYSA